MIALKAIHAASFTPTLHHHHHHYTRPLNARPSLLCLCKSNDSDSEAPQQPQGDAQSQELLAQIAMLQTQKVRLTGFIDERSEYLSQFGEEAKAEFDKVGEDALKGLDEAGARVCVFNHFSVTLYNSKLIHLPTISSTAVSVVNSEMTMV